MQTRVYCGIVGPESPSPEAMRSLTTILAGILLCGCEPAPSPLADLHDSKYSEVKVGGGASGHCTLDRFTGLMWEVKGNEPGLHDWRNTYSWFDPEESNYELDYRGVRGGGVCAGSPAIPRNSFAPSMQQATADSMTGACRHVTSCNR